MIHTLRMIFFCAGMTFLLVAATPAIAQTEHTSSGKQKREMRSSMKEAQKIETDFNESHLNIRAYNHRKGESGRKLKKQKRRDLMPINENGTAPTKPVFFFKKNGPIKVKKK